MKNVLQLRNKAKKDCCHRFQETEFPNSQQVSLISKELGEAS